MTTIITISQTNTGWRVTRHKTEGTEKGDTTIASTCGGQIGRIIAIDATRMAMLFLRADQLIIEAFDEATAHALREDIESNKPTRKL